MSKNLYLALLLSVFIPAIAFSQTVEAFKNGQFYSSSGYGHVTPCTPVGFRVVGYTVPSGYAQVDRFEWYYGTTLVHTETNPFESGCPPITLNNRTADVICRIYYRTAAPPYSYTSQDSGPYEPLFRTSTVTVSTSTTSVVPGCASSVTYTTSAPPPSGQFADAFFSPPSYTVSYTPPTGWTQTSISGDGHSVTFSPTGTGNTLVATVLLPCGYTETLNVQAPQYTYPAPTFSGSNNYNVCTSSASFAINAVCGATDYTYTVSASVGSASFPGGATTLTTSATSVTIDFTSSSVVCNLSVKANYPGGVSSVNATTGVNAGAQYGTGVYRYNYGPDIPWSGSQVNLINLSPSQSVPFIVQPTLPPNTVSYSWAPAMSPVVPYTVVGKDLYFSLGGGNSHQMQFTFTTNQGACGTMVRYIMFILTGYGYRMVDSTGPAIPIDPPAISSVNRFAISPNPAASTVRVTLGNTVGGTSELVKVIRIFDLQGKLWKQYHYKGASQVELPVTDLSNGVYIIEISGANRIIREKLVVQR
jgi:hypothetical protein